MNHAVKSNVATVSNEQVDFILPCNSSIYCYGDLLYTVQMLQAVGNDSKYFVDMPMKSSPTVVHGHWEEFKVTHPNPTQEQVSDWVNDNFLPPGHALDIWVPPDWKENPAFIEQVPNDELKTFALNLNKIWLELSRVQISDVSEQPDRFTSITLPNGVIIPGGRFREIYYWDTYWIIEGLLVCGMQETARGVVDNLISFVNEFGFVPNGGRRYYENRSQPPMLIQMAWKVYQATNDADWLKQSLPTLVREYQFWQQNRSVQISIDGETLSVNRYATNLGYPRPESYREDMQTADATTTDFTYEQQLLFSNLGSGAESGCDFSTRWFNNVQDYNDFGLVAIKTRGVIPVDLNSILGGNERTLSNMFNEVGDSSQAEIYLDKFNERKKIIHKVFWNEKLGYWFDYNINTESQNTNFYSAFIAPWWQKCVDTPTGVPDSVMEKAIVQYLKTQGIFSFPGGVPYSLVRSGQQWDLPNVWAPPTDMLITSLTYPESEKSTHDLGIELASKWVGSAYKGYQTYGQMFEKYDCDLPGQPGGGGEYTNQIGFGWTNGLTLKLINQLGDFDPNINRNGNLKISHLLLVFNILCTLGYISLF